MDSWVANLADGSTRVEEWLPGHISPWQRLMEYCKKNRTYVTNLRLTIGKETKSCPSNAKGYWQAHGMPAVQGIECDEELHKWRGIGWVEGDMVRIIWGARDPRTKKVAWWMDARPAKNQGQIIWALPSLSPPPLEDIMEKPRSQSSVRGVKRFTDAIVEDAGGIREVYVPGHVH